VNTLTGDIGVNYELSVVTQADEIVQTYDPIFSLTQFLIRGGVWLTVGYLKIKRGAGIQKNENLYVKIWSYLKPFFAKVNWQFSFYRMT